MHPRILKPVGALLSLTILFAVFATVQAQSITPSEVVETIADGESVTIDKTVETPAIPPVVDIYFLADTTSSMTSVIGQVQTDAGTVLATLSGGGSDVRFGAGDYKDFPFDVYAFSNAAPIPAVDDGGAAALAAIGAWSASGGSDGSEGQFYALQQIASSAANFRTGATRMVVWFGDAPAHDPVCSAISGLGSDITEASLTADLVAADIRVVAISTLTGFPSGLDDDPTLPASDYSGACATIDGASGQATRIAAATGGVHLTGVAANQISQAILDGISAVEVEVAMVSDCAATTGGVVNTTFSDPQLVPSGTPVEFDETISVSAGPDQQGQVYECNDWATIDGEPMVDVNGQIIYEHKTITVPDTTPPGAACTPTTNPSGRNVPAAPGNGGQGQNQDGFYELLARDNVDDDPQIFVTDDATGTVFGPFASGTKIKLTQAPGSDPTIKPGPGVIDWHITIPGDAVVTAVDAAGNVSDPASCLVPPPPQ